MMRDESSSPERRAKKTKLNISRLKLYCLLYPFIRPKPIPIYPLTFATDMSISEYLSSFRDLDRAKEVCFAGVIIDKHIVSETSFIYKLHDLVLKENAHVQVNAEARNSCMEDAEFSKFHRSLKLGVLLGLSGLPEENEKGDPAICSSLYVVLTTEPNKELPPRSLTSKDTSSLKRFQKIMRDKRVAPIFKLRYEIVNYISSFLQGHSLFKEGTLNVEPGKLPANDHIVSFHSRPPFQTWHHSVMQSRLRLYARKTDHRGE